MLFIIIIIIIIISQQIKKRFLLFGHRLHEMQLQPGSMKFVIHKKMYSLFSVFLHVGLNVIGF